jgi:hypothetical protein
MYFKQCLIFRGFLKCVGLESTMIEKTQNKGFKVNFFPIIFFIPVFRRFNMDFNKTAQ